jgi:hypothetical protein
MGWFGFGGKSQPQPAPRRRIRPPLPPPSAAAPAAPRRCDGPSLTVLMRDEVNVDHHALASAIAARTGRPARAGNLIAPLVGFDAAPNASASDSGTVFSLDLDGVPVRCVQVHTPAPGLETEIAMTRNDPAELAPLLAGTSHVMCFATAAPEAALAAIEALMVLAVALREQGALGIIHTDARQCFLIDHVAAHLEPESLAAIRAGGFKLVWCNLHPFRRPSGGVWWTSKGHHVFGVPDVAMLVHDEFDGAQVGNIVRYLFDYVRGGRVIKHGETINLGQKYLIAAGPVTEHPDFLEGMGETLALRIIDRR